MAIGMNKGRGVARAKAGIGVPKKATFKPGSPGNPQAPTRGGSVGGFKAPPPGGAPKKSLPPGPYGSYKSHQKGKK